MRHRGLPFAALALFFIAIHPAQAVPPPDFIFSVGSQVVQFFTFIMVIVSAVIGSVWQFLRARFSARGSSMVFLVSCGLLGVLIAAAGAYWYGVFSQREAYSRWLAESERFAAFKKNDPPPVTTSTPPAEPVVPTGPVEPEVVFASAVSSTDPVERAVIEHYRTESASWKNRFVRRVELLSVVLIDDVHVATMFREQTATSSRVMNGLVKIASSTPPRIGDAIARPVVTPTEPDVPLELKNAEFKVMLDRKDPVFVLDARENIENEYGRFPGSTHIRFADLKAGRWLELPQDARILVLCWSGIRGKEVAEFLRTKSLRASFLEKGADGWVTFGGTWDGEIKFAKIFSDARYAKLLTYDQVKKGQAAGAIVLDSRDTAPTSWRLPGSISLPLIHTTSRDFSRAISALPRGSRVITICDDFVSCFDAKLVGVEVERRGMTFLGRWNEPWKAPGYHAK